jgi:hypothetical protein
MPAKKTTTDDLPGEGHEILSDLRVDTKTRGPLAKASSAMQKALKEGAYDQHGDNLLARQPGDYLSKKETP